METQKVGIREFRDNLSEYLLKSESPVAITRHGDTVGHYIPVRRKRTEEERAALERAAARWQEVVDSMGLSEDEILEDFKRWRAGDRQA
jgi:antitoxin (DNA-binding transcriptional repressor) of toxin-antitoxin stability system